MSFTRLLQTALPALCLVVLCAAGAAAKMPPYKHGPCAGLPMNTSHNAKGVECVPGLSKEPRSQMQGPRPEERAAPVLTPSQYALQDLSVLIRDVPHRSAEVDNLIRDLRDQNVKNTGGTGAGTFGRFVAQMAGVGKCTRHFYNKTNDGYWAIGMLNSGTCEIGGGPRGMACVIPPHATATLHYSNFGNAETPSIAIAAFSMSGKNYSKIFNLREVGCYIEHSGRTPSVNLNQPADGDVEATW